jgi:hypothetical protein
MTPFEKAKDLIDRFARLDGYDDSIDLSKCEFEKQCALVVVNELIKETGSKYWYDVKHEIEKL